MAGVRMISETNMLAAFERDLAKVNPLKIILSNKKLDHLTICKLVPIIQLELSRSDSKLHSIDLRGNDIEDKSALVLKELWCFESKLAVVDLSSNKITFEAALELIQTAVYQLNQKIQFNFENNPISAHQVLKLQDLATGSYVSLKFSAFTPAQLQAELKIQTELKAKLVVAETKKKSTPLSEEQLRAVKALFVSTSLTEQKKTGVGRRNSVSKHNLFGEKQPALARSKSLTHLDKSVELSKDFEKQWVSEPPEEDWVVVRPV